MKTNKKCNRISQILLTRIKKIFIIITSLSKGEKMMADEMKQMMFKEADYCFACANDCFYTAEERDAFAEKRAVFEELFEKLGILNEYMGI